MLSVIYTECRIKVLYAERHYAECRCAECHNAKCRYAECRGAPLQVGSFLQELPTK